MRTKTIILIAVLVAACAYAANAQNPCSCKTFPYWYCKKGLAPSDSSRTTWCTANPSTDGPGAGYSLVKAATPYGCIEIGNIQSGAVVVGGVDSLTSTRPGLIVSPSADFNSIGDLFTPDYPGAPNNMLEDQWRGDNGVIKSCLPNATFDNSCCIDVLFRSDPSWWQNEMKNPNFDLKTGALGEVTLPWDSSNCQIHCDNNDLYKRFININTTPQFFSDEKPGVIPTELARDYVNFTFRPAVSHGNIGVGQWDSVADTVYVNKAYDFSSVVLHEMLHWSGLPDRGDKCKNTNAPCGSDSKSIMSPLDAGLQRWHLDEDDCCWLTKLYNPGSIPPCAGGVNEGSGIATLSLLPAHPNPTNGETTIGFSTDRSLEFDLDVYDVLGRTVFTVARGQVAAPGQHEFTIPAGALPSGKYIYCLHTGDKVLSKVLTVVK